MSSPANPPADPDNLNTLFTHATGAWRAPIIVQEGLLAKLQRVSSLLNSLGRPVTAPSLLCQRKEGDPVVLQEIGNSLSVGRGAQAGWPLPDATSMSRVQFRVFFENGGWWIEDPGSRNGTFFVDSKDPITRRPLANGDVILAGGFLFAFVLPE